MADYIINPLKLNDPEADPVIKELFNEIVRAKQLRKSPFFARGEYYIRRDGKLISVELTHDLLMRERRTSSGDYRLEVLEPNSFANGGFGHLYLSLGVIKPELNYVFNSKTRVCKAIAFDTDAATREDITRESVNTQKNELLHSKDVVFDEQFGGYIVMRKAGDIDLFDFYDRSDRYRLKLTLQQRLQLVLNILEAVNKQVYELGLIHNDLKLENMLVNSNDLSVIIVDYAMAQNLSEPPYDQTLRGTADYLAPEIYTAYMRSHASDVFAIGITIARLFGDLSRNQMDLISNLDTLLNIIRDQRWKALFRNISAPKELQERIILFINSLTAFEPTTRPRIPDAIENWKGIMELYKKWESQKTFQSTKHFTPYYSETSPHWMFNKPRPPRTPSHNTGITQGVEKELISRTVSCCRY